MKRFILSIIWTLYNIKRKMQGAYIGPFFLQVPSIMVHKNAILKTIAKYNMLYIPTINVIFPRNAHVVSFIISRKKSMFDKLIRFVYYF